MAELKERLFRCSIIVTLAIDQPATSASINNEQCLMRLLLMINRRLLCCLILHTRSTSRKVISPNHINQLANRFRIRFQLSLWKRQKVFTRENVDDFLVAFAKRNFLKCRLKNSFRHLWFWILLKTWEKFRVKNYLETSSLGVSFNFVWNSTLFAKGNSHKSSQVTYMRSLIHHPR